MFIAPVLLFLAFFLAVGLTLAVVTSLILGAVLADAKHRLLRPPVPVRHSVRGGVRAAVGAVVVGYFAAQADENAIVWGPMLGLIGGGVFRGRMGTLAGVAWSRAGVAWTRVVPERRTRPRTSRLAPGGRPG